MPRRKLDDDDPRSHYERGAAARELAGNESRKAFGHLADILIRGKKPSRDQSTWGDRTGAEDQAYEKEQRYQDSVKAHRTKASFFGVRG